MSLVLATTALKITNHGGGTMYRTVPSVSRVNGKDVLAKTDRGSDYVTFVCPHPRCGRRQKHSMYDAEPYSLPEADRTPFKCRFCRNIIEVARPTDKGGSLLVTPQEFSQEMAQRRKEIGVNQPKLVR